MITDESTTHKIELNDKSKVIEILTAALDNPNFHSFNMYIDTDYGGLLKKPTKSYCVSVDLRFKRNDDTQTTDRSPARPA